MPIVPNLSTGDPSTLGSYRKLAHAAGLTEAVAYLDQKIAESPNGENEVVLADERQMIYLLFNMRSR